MIKGLKNRKRVNLNKILVFDIETFSYKGGVQLPYAIGFVYQGNITLLYITDFMRKGEKGEGEVLRASDLMIDEFIKYLDKLKKGVVVFAHNLGKFDGYFILKRMMDKQPQVLVDGENAIITISYTNPLKATIRIKDSYRILPSSLKELCIKWGVSEQINKLAFNHNIVNLDLILSTSSDHYIVDSKGILRAFREVILEYLSHDVLSLNDIINKATLSLFNDYQVNLLDSFSTSSLAMRIFRTKFLPTTVSGGGIPILPQFYDKIIRESYMGGLVNVYEPYGKNLYYYDINSLYPYAMKNPMPGELIRKVVPSEGVNGGDSSGELDLDKFFGFVQAEIEVPKGINKPKAPLRLNGKLVSPTGKWCGLYFSEELKAFVKWGYKVKPLMGYEHQKIYPFNKYVDHFYQLKKEAKGNANRYMIKLLLNGLYGFFGRKPIEEVVDIVPNDQVASLLALYPASFTIEFEGVNYTAIKRDIHPSKDFCIQNGVDYLQLRSLNIDGRGSKVKANVAIASAITAYSRIILNQYMEIARDNCVYSDTDSIITKTPLPTPLIGTNIGLMKDELHGDIISEGYFLAPKIYGLKIKEGGRGVKPSNSYRYIIKAKGVTPGLVKFEDLAKLYRGESISYNVSRLYRNTNNLSITHRVISITLKPDFSDTKRINIFHGNQWIGTRPIHLNLIPPPERQEGE